MSGSRALAVTASTKLKVLDAIVCTISVQVMHCFLLGQDSAKVFGHDETVFKDVA